MPTTVLWFRRDLRLHDNPALLAAAEAAGGGRVVPVFVGDAGLLRASRNRRHALVQALRALDSSLEGALVYREGDPAVILPRLAREVEASSVHVSAETTPYGRARDARVEEALGERDVDLVRTGSPYAIGPGTVRNGSGDPYQVFTPFSRAWRDHGAPAPAQLPTGLRWHRQVEGRDLPALPSVPRDVALPEVGEDAALDRWQEFRDDLVEHYADERDDPAADSTSRLSVHLKFGTVHPRTLLADLRQRRGDGVRTFVTELAWREFYADVLWHSPDSAWSDLKPALRGMRYADPDSADVARDIAAWREGRTGFPIVDAGMRQLVQEGWMHNRLRMITASFLTKHLHVWWPIGARHFLEHLVDGDIASNNHGWQWVAGTGTDASPYFRIFNPVTQGLRFDPDGAYVRRWVPELRDLSGKAAHEPWKHAGPSGDYPDRILDLAEEREEALHRYQAARD